MADTLDVLIAFVIIIIGLSVLLQVIVEALKNILRLRWSVYERFLRSYFSDLLKNESMEEGLFYRLLRFIPDTGKRQKIASATGRFRNFYNTLSSYCREIEDLKAKLILLKAEIKGRRGISVTNHSYTINEMKNSVIKLKPENLKRISELQSRALTGMIDEKLVRKFTDTLKDIEKLLESIQKESVSEDASVIIDRMIETITEVEKRIKEYMTRISSFFEEGLRELEMRYVRHIAVWTFLIGFVMVCLLNADSIRIYRVLREEPLVRSGIIEQSQYYTESIRVPFLSERLNKLSMEAEQIRKGILEGRFNKKTLRAFSKEVNSFLQSMKTYVEVFNRRAVQKISLPYSLKEELSSLKMFVDMDELKEPERLSALVDNILVKATENHSSLMLSIIKSKRQMLYQGRLPLGWQAAEAGELLEGYNLLKKFAGLLITAVLISFGAPFWNDVLKALFGIKGFLRKKGEVEST
ncbi:MAG: hypothetical protein GXO97_09865 [Nitrospirae bacterium]|nr:hypothetical protein [Nitrospirota bacterium]